MNRKKFDLHKLTTIRPCLGQQEILKACLQEYLLPDGLLNLRGREGKGFIEINQNMTFLLEGNENLISRSSANMQSTP